MRWFPRHYQQAYRQLSRAAQIYKEMPQDLKERTEWREEIKRNIPDLDNDLIARLSGNPRDLTDEHLALLAEKGGDSSPSEIALEQAARWCGVERYKYTKRGLLKRLESAGPTENASIIAGSGMHTFLLNWYRLGRDFTKEQRAQVLSLASTERKIKKLPLDFTSEGE